MHADFQQMSLPRDQAPETQERRMISPEKLMVTIAWNSHGFRVIELLEKGETLNADYYCSSMITKLSTRARRFRNEHKESDSSRRQRLSSCRQVKH
jgi:hypothetical protein